MKKKQIVLVVLFTMMLLGLQLPIQANASVLNFSVEPVIPNNQVDKQHTYFDLKMAPSKEQTLVVRLKNDTDEEVVVNTQVNDAKTNMNGVVEYSGSKDKLDSSIKYKVTDIMKAENKEVIIPAKGKADAKFTVKMPSEIYDGLIVGGISFEEKEKKETKKKKSKKGMAIENKYAYAVAVVLRETDNALPPNVKMSNVRATQVNARNAIRLDLHNTQPIFLNKVSIDARVTEKGKKETLYKRSDEGMQMAPNTIMDYPILLNGKELKPGNYTLHSTVKSKDGKWNFSKNFKISAEQAENYNKKDVTIEKKDHTWLYVGIGIGAILVVTIIILLILLLRKKKNK